MFTRIARIALAAMFFLGTFMVLVPALPAQAAPLSAQTTQCSNGQPTDQTTPGYVMVTVVPTYNGPSVTLNVPAGYSGNPTVYINFTWWSGWNRHNYGVQLFGYGGSTVGAPNGANAGNVSDITVWYGGRRYKPAINLPYTQLTSYSFILNRTCW
jgi:hypothetical protein